MKFAYCYAGGNTPAIKEFDIKADASVNAGEVVCAFDGVITENVNGGTVIGVCEETHTGKEDMLNTRSNGTKVRVNVTDGVYEAEAMKLCAIENGTETVFKCESAGLSDAAVGGCLVLVEKARGSTNTDKIGTARKITGITVNGETAAVTVENGAAAYAGDVYVLIPALGAKIKLNSAKNGYCFDNAQTDVTLSCVGFDTKRAKVYVKLTNTLFA